MEVSKPVRESKAVSVLPLMLNVAPPSVPTVAIPQVDPLIVLPLAGVETFTEHVAEVLALLFFVKVITFDEPLLTIETNV